MFGGLLVGRKKTRWPEYYAGPIKSLSIAGAPRNMGDHRHDGTWYDVTDQLLRG
jgi:hypothetical protein